MDLALVVLLQVLFQPALSVLFTVEAEQPTYQSEFQGDVVMGCRFDPKVSDLGGALQVTWSRIPSAPGRHVLLMDNGKEHLESQDPDFHGRVRLLREELKDGWAKLQISRLRISDSGMYQCLVKTAQGADYISIGLTVKASYKEVKKHTETTAKGDEALLTCQAEGYPEASVVWQDGNMQKIESNTTAEKTTEQLFKVISYIQVPSAHKSNYTCSFSNHASATFHIPDELILPDDEKYPVVIILGLMVILAVIAVFMYRKRKVLFESTGLTVKQRNPEENTVLNISSREENLEASVKAHYSQPTFCAEMRNSVESFNVEELLHRLRNNEGQPVNLQALLPEAGGTLFLEGPPGSGKTTLAHILISSWTAEPTARHADLLDLGALRLLLYVDCSRAKDDLYQEIAAQFSLTENITEEDKLRTELTRSRDALLVLDGYTEGTQTFDESLRRFLKERGDCRVLVMACPGQWGTLKEELGAVRVLELQSRTVKY